MRLLTYALTCGIALSAGSGLYAQAPFIEENSIIVMECENVDFMGTDWELRTERGGWHHDGYLRWEGPDLFNTEGQGLIEFPIRITNPGEYNLRMYSQHNGHSADDDNDVWIKLQDEGGDAWRKLFSNQGGGQMGMWDWDSRFDFGHGNQPDASFEFEAGDHVIQLSGRSNGMMIDRFHLYQDHVDNPLDLNRPESSRQMRGHDFRTDEPHGFESGTAPELDDPLLFEDNRGLVIRHQPTDQITFGNWTGEIPDTQMQAGEVWEVVFHVTTNATAEQRHHVPSFRLRLNDSSLHTSMSYHVESRGNALDVPVAGEVKEYPITYRAREAAAGNTLFGALDFIYVPHGSDDDPSIEVILERIEARKIR